MQSCCHAIRKYPSFCGEITTNVRFITSQKNLDLTEIVSIITTTTTITTITITTTITT